MTFSWTPHRFAGGLLALDVANSIILRHDDARRTDRFAVAVQLDAFPGAAAMFCGERALFGSLTPVTAVAQPAFLAMREAIDRHFRARIGDVSGTGELADLLESLATVLRQASDTADLGVATARSALRLLAQPDDGRLKTCPNCGWLFFDRSKNRSRTWCDMAVCGNRSKAHRHYHRKTGEDEP